MTRRMLAIVLCVAAVGLSAAARGPRGSAADYRPDTAGRPVSGYRLVWSDEFHVWELKGSDAKVQILLDGELMNEVTHEVARNPETRWSHVVYPFKQKHSLILDLAIGGPGGNPSKARFPMRYEVDYARVYQRK